MSTHNICFRGEIRKYQQFSDEKSALSVAMTVSFTSLFYFTELNSNSSGACVHILVD